MHVAILGTRHCDRIVRIIVTRRHKEQSSIVALRGITHRFVHIATATIAHCVHFQRTIPLYSPRGANTFIIFTTIQFAFSGFLPIHFLASVRCQRLFQTPHQAHHSCSTHLLTSNVAGRHYLNDPKFDSLTPQDVLQGDALSR